MPWGVVVRTESVDQIAVVRFGPSGAAVERTIPIGMSLMDPDGPHGVAVAPSGEWRVLLRLHGARESVRQPLEVPCLHQ